jgi:hypothetical protein
MNSPLIRSLPRHCPYKDVPGSILIDTCSRRSALTIVSFVTIAALMSIPTKAPYEEEWVWSDSTSWDEA